MRIITLVAAAALICAALLPGSAWAQTEEDCLTEAILAESTLAKSETIVGDGVVGYSIYRHSIDGRWGTTICETVAKRYAHTAYRMVKAKKRHKARRVGYTRYVYDYSYKGMSYYNDILTNSKKVRPALLARARLVAQVQLAHAYEPEDGFAEVIDYLYPEKSSEAGKLWFACTAKPLGKIEPTSVHMMHREQTDEELQETLATEPRCKRYVEIFKRDRDRNRLRRQSAGEVAQIRN